MVGLGKKRVGFSAWTIADPTFDYDGTAAWTVADPILYIHIYDAIYINIFMYIHVYLYIQCIHYLSKFS